MRHPAGPARLPDAPQPAKLRRRRNGQDRACQTANLPPYTGGCACGAVRYLAVSRPFWSAHCHCEDCRRATGAAVSSFLGFAKAGVRWEGQRAFRASSPGTTRGFCPACATPLSYMSTRWPGEIHLHAGTLDDPASFSAEAHVNWAARVPWIAIADDLPKHAGPGRAHLPSQRAP